MESLYLALTAVHESTGRDFRSMIIPIIIRCILVYESKTMGRSSRLDGLKGEFLRSQRFASYRIIKSLD